jgi:hypothetical protein
MEEKPKPAIAMTSKPVGNRQQWSTSVDKTAQSKNS